MSQSSPSRLVELELKLILADPNKLLGITVFNIPETITKYLTYTLIIHIIALACGIAATIFGLLSHISTLSVMCFPTCFASLTSSFSLLALILDLVIFYIAKSRIDDVSGASATIGSSVWLTLAAWIIAGVAGFAYGIGRCCIGQRSNRDGGDPKVDNNGYRHQGGPDDMRLQAIRDEQVRKKEQGLPSFQELERTPLTAGEGDDRYLYEDQPSQSTMQGSLRRDGSLVQGVGVGYGRKNSRTPMNGGQVLGYGGGWGGPPDGYGNYGDLAPVPIARRPSARSGVTSAGGAGVGAGGAGVERAEPQGYGGYYGAGQQNCECSSTYGWYQRSMMLPDHEQHQQGYDDPYQQQQQAYDYSTQHYNPTTQPQAQHYYPPQSHTPMPNSQTPMPMPAATPAPRNVSGPYDPYSGAASSESHYHDPGPRVSQADAYDGYDDGLGAIGMAATSPVIDQPSHQRDYTGGTFGYPEQRHYPTPAQVPLHIPTPQLLVTGNNSAANLLRSPSDQREDTGRGGAGTGARAERYDYDEEEEEDQGMRPPSYGAVAGSSGYQPSPANEKDRYR